MLAGELYAPVDGEIMNEQGLWKRERNEWQKRTTITQA